MNKNTFFKSFKKMSTKDSDLKTICSVLFPRRAVKAYNVKICITLEL